MNLMKTTINNATQKSPLWTCCNRSRRSLFCPECGTHAPKSSDATEMLAELQIEVQKYTTTADTHISKAEATEKLIGCCPYNCGWTLYEIAKVIDDYDIRETMGRVTEMELEEFREQFAIGLRKRAEGFRSAASAAVKNMLKWRRWHRILENEISKNAEK